MKHILTLNIIIDLNTVEIIKNNQGLVVLRPLHAEMLHVIL